MKKLLEFFIGVVAVFLSAGVSASGLPQANMTVSPAIGRINSEFTLDASQSRNAAGNKGGVEIRYKRSSGGDWSPWSRQLIQKFTPMDIGTMRVYLQVRDINTGQIQSTFRSIKVVSTMARRAWISVEDFVVEVGQPIDFQLELVLQSFDNKDDVEVRWDFNSDGIWDTNFSQRKFVTYVYDTATMTSPIAEVRFFDDEIITVKGIAPRWTPGRRSSDPQATWNKIKVISPTITAPIVDVRPGRVGFNESTVFHFDASSARIPRGGWIEWSFDGQQWLRFPGKQTAEHQFTSPGKHEVRTRVCISYSNPRCEETTTAIEVERDPLDYQVAISLQNRTNAHAMTVRNAQQYVIVEVGDRIRFTAQLRNSSGSGQHYLYRWDYNNDGIWDTHFSSQNYTEHVYDRGGTFTVRVQVQNQDNVVANTVRNIFVDINEKPIAEIQSSVDEIYVGEKVRFSPRFPKQWPDNSSRTQVRFDLDGDGLWESDFQGVGGRDITYLVPGEITIVMEIRDPGKNVSTVRKTIEILPYPAVKARVIVSQRIGSVGKAVTFDASGSAGRKLRFFWDFDTQESVPVSTRSFDYFRNGSLASTISHTWVTPGEKTVSLMVVDAQGKVDMIEFPVSIQ